MPNYEETPTTDTAQIERLIERLKQGKLQEQDAQLIETLLHFVLKITSLLKRKQTTIKGLKQIFFGLGKRSGRENKSDHQVQRQSQTQIPPMNSSLETAWSSISEGGAASVAKAESKRPGH